MKTQERFFTELDTASLSGKTIILDIDGTLAHDGAETIDAAARSIVADLATRNHVYLLSNKPTPERNRLFSELLAVPYLHAPHRKPHRGIVKYLPDNHREAIVVIGDKYLTDGLFARRIGAQFIKVRHVRGLRETIATTVSYGIDDAAYRLFRSLTF